MDLIAAEMWFVISQKVNCFYIYIYIFCILLVGYYLSIEKIGFRCNVFIPSNSLATKGNRGCQKGWKSS
jgi:hypothetical protein